MVNKKSLPSSRSFFPKQSNVLNLKKKSPIIEIHIPVLKDFYFEHKNTILKFVSFVVCLSILTSFFRVNASTAVFYPENCLGGWQHTKNAQGKPSLEEDAPAEKFTIQNSAVLGNSSAQIFCGAFVGEIPEDTMPKKFLLSLRWSVDDGSVVHQNETDIGSPFGSAEKVPSSIPESNAENTASEDTTVPTTDTVPPEDASVITITPSESQDASSTSEPTPTTDGDQSFLDYFSPTKVHAEDTQSDSASIQTEQPVVLENTTSTSLQEINTVSNDTPVDSSTTVETESQSEEIQNNTSLEVLSTPEDDGAFAKVSYTLDGVAWNTLGKVSVANWKQSTFDIPLGAWTDISKLQVSIDTIVSYDKQPVVYLDAMEISVEYEEGKIFQKPTVTIKNGDAQVLEGDTDFSSGEAPMFAVVDPNLSRRELADLVKDKKAEVVQDSDKVLSPEPEKQEIVQTETSTSNTLLDGIKNVFSRDVENDTPKENNTDTQTSQPVSGVDTVPASESTAEGAQTVPVEVIEGAPAEETVVAPENTPTETPKETPVDTPTEAPVETPVESDPVVALTQFFKKTTVPKIASRPRTSLPKRTENENTHLSLFAPLVAYAEDISARTPKITNARVLDYNGNPTTIKTKVQTVTIDGESRDGVSIEKQERHFRAGRYTLEVTVETATAIIISQQDFTWGVLAVNVDKSVYSAGDTAFLQMGVLDDKGNTLCDAPLELSIKSPSGAVQHFRTTDDTILQSKKCARNNVVEVADYYAHYPILGEPGTYIIRLTAHTDNGTRTIRDAFVVGSPDFDVSRAAPTRIYPFSKYNYPMTIRITPKYDWSGTVVETIPAGFVISQPKSSQKYDTLKSTDELTTLTWDVDLKAGEETVLGYLFKGPEVSPEFFLIGPLEFFDKGADPITAIPAFKESRSWQIADDATCTAAANGPWNTSGTWSCGNVPTSSDSVVINAGVTVTMDVNSASVLGVTINGTLDTITSGTSYSLTTTTLTIGSTGTLTANASTITLTGTTGTLFTITSGGVFTQGTSEVVVTSASGTPTLLSAATTFHRLKINSTATVINAGAAITMSSADSANRLYLDFGVLNDGGNQIVGTANGTLVIDGGAALCIGGTASSTNATCNSGATPTSATVFPTNYTNGNITMNVAGGSGWYNPSWGYRTKLTIDESKVGASDSSDFPVLVSLTDNRFRTTANGGHMGNAGATDMLFTSSDGTTKLKHEVEYYLASTGQVIAWVKIPTLSSSTNTEIYMYYGNAGAAAQADAANVWTNGFKSVLHVSDGTTLSATDSTGTYNGTVSGTTATTGQIDGGMAVTCGNEITSPQGLYTMVGGGSTYSLSMWVYQTSTGNRYIWDGDSTNGLSAFMSIQSGINLEWGNRDIASEGILYRVYTGLSLGSGSWHHILAQKTGSGNSGELYVNGALKTTYTGSIGGLSNSSSGMYWGNYHNFATSCLDGTMDEMRISSTTRSADWVTAEYNNQSSPSTFFLTPATEEAVESDATVYYNADANTTISSTPTYRNLVITPPITGTPTYTFASGATTINGNFTINPSGSTALTVNMGDDITVASTKTTTITRTSTATSKLATVSNGNDLSSGIIVIDTACELTATGTTSTITLTGTSGTLLTNTGTFTEGTSTVAVASATGPVALLSAAETFHILTINSASSSTVVNATAAVTIADATGSALTVTSGVFNDSGLGIATSGSTNNTLTLGSAGTLCLGGAAGANTATTCDTSATSTTTRAMPTFASYSFNATSTVIYLSDAATTIANAQTYGNLIFRPRFVATARTYTLGGAMTINGDFTIQPTNFAALLTVNPAGNITVASGKTTTISGTTATSTLDLRPSSTDYNLSTGLLVVASGGTLDAGSAASVITLSGTSGTLFTRAGTFTQGSSVVTLSGNGAATINSGTITFYDLTQTGTGTKTVGSSSALTINHDLIISAGEFAPNLQLVTASGTNVLSVASGATLYVDTSTFAGNYTGFDTRTISAGSTVDYKLAGTQTVDSTLTYSNLVISGASGTKSPDGNITATLTFVQSGGNTFDLLPSATDYNLTTGNLTIGTGCTLDGGSSSSVITLTGTSGTLFTKTGTYTQGTTEVAVTSASGTPTLLSAATTFHRLRIHSTATVINAGAAITMSSTSALNRLYVQAGVFNDGGNQITGTANGTLIVAGGATLCIGGTSSATNATCDSGATPTSATTFPTNYTSGNISIYSASSAGAWYSSSWGYRTKIIIDDTKVSTTNHTDFPVLINSTNADWKYTGSGGHVGNSDGSDILFTSSDGTTKLKHEIERYTAASGEVIAWVKVPTLTTSGDTELYMYYGNAGVGAQADAVNVWDSNFKTVLHLGDGSTLSATSSTGINNGTKVGTISALAGKIGGAACANGTTQCSGTASTSNGLTFTTFSSTTPTLTAWIKLDNASGYQNVAALNNSNGVWLNAGKMDLYTTADHNANTSVGTGAWVHVGMTYDGTTIRYYYNGATDGTGSAFAFNYQINAMFKDANGTAETLKGSMDEIRFSNVVRSAGWIETEYNTMNSPSTFYSLGVEEVYGASSAIVYYNADANTTVSATPTYADLRLRPVLTGDKTYTVSSALTVNGDLSINPSGSANTLTVNAGGHITLTYGTTTITRQGSNALSSLDLRPSSTDYNLSSQYLTIATGGTLDATSAASTITLTGTSGTLITFGGTFNVGTSTVLISGNGTATLNSGVGNFYHLTQNATGTKSLGANITIDPAATLTITLGTLDTTGSNYIISAGHIDIANSASAVLTANASAVGLTGTSGTLLTRGSSGVFTAGTSIVTASGNGTATFNSGTFTGSNAFNDLISSGTGTKTLGAAIDIGGTFGVTGGTFALSSHNIGVTGVTIGASGTIDGGSATITNSGGWTNSGTYTSSTSTVLFNTASTITISGTTSFNNLTITHTAAKVVNFAASGGTPTYTVTGAFTVTGHAAALIKLWSASGGTKWDLLPSGTASVDYVDVMDGGCHSGAININPTNATNSGNNDSCWGFNVAPTITFSINSNSVPLGTLTSVGTGSGSHTISMSTNTGALLLSYIGATLTSGANTIPAYPSLSASVAGTAGFGINAVDTAISNASGTCSAAIDYATASAYTFVTGTTTPFVTSSSPADCTITATYKANISTVTAAGSYSTGLTYIVTGTF